MNSTILHLGTQATKPFHMATQGSQPFGVNPIGYLKGKIGYFPVSTSKFFISLSSPREDTNSYKIPS